MPLWISTPSDWTRAPGDSSQTDCSANLLILRVRTRRLVPRLVRYYVAKIRGSFLVAPLAELTNIPDYFQSICENLSSKTRSKHIKGSKERLFIRTQTQSANLCQATKRHLNKSYTMKNNAEWDEKRSIFFGWAMLFSYPVLGRMENNIAQPKKISYFASHFIFRRFSRFNS